MKLRVKISIALLSLAIIPLVITAVIIANSTLSRLKLKTQEFRVAVADGSRRTARRLVSESRFELDNIATIFLRGIQDPNALRALIADELKKTLHVNQLALYLPNGKLVEPYRAKELKNPISPLLKLPQSLLQVTQADSEVSLRVRWSKDGRPFLPIVSAVYVKALKTRLILWAPIDLAPLSKEIARISLSRFQVPDAVFLIDHEFRIVAHSDPKKIGTYAPNALRESVPNLKKDIAHSTTYAIGDNKYLVTALPLPKLHWAVVVQQPAGEAFAAVRETWITTAVVGGLFILFAIIVGIVLGGRLAAPIRRIADTAEIVAKGNFETQVPVTSNDEVGQLARSFNSMTLNLKEYRTQLVEETRIRSDLTRYLSPHLVDEIVAHKSELRLGGERRLVTVMFADVCAFTPLSERLGPEEIVGILNELFTFLTEIVFKHGGMIDKFIGDCVMAVFGAPEGKPDDALRCVRAAEEMMKWLDVGNARWQQMIGSEVALGIGINTGMALAGNIGSEKRMEYTVIGDAVNVAARLESLAKPGQVLMTHDTMKLVEGEFDCISLGQHPLYGRKESVEVFELDI